MVALSSCALASAGVDRPPPGAADRWRRQRCAQRQFIVAKRRDQSVEARLLDGAQPGLQGLDVLHAEIQRAFSDGQPARSHRRIGRRCWLAAAHHAADQLCVRGDGVAAGRHANRVGPGGVVESVALDSQLQGRERSLTAKGVGQHLIDRWAGCHLGGGVSGGTAGQHGDPRGQMGIAGPELGRHVLQNQDVFAYRL
jgi:hypothetical protein